MGWIVCEFCGGKKKRRSDARDQYFCGFECRSRMKRRVYMRRLMRKRRGRAQGPSFSDLYPGLR